MSLSGEIGGDRRYTLWAAIAVTLVAFLGFVPSYWAKLLDGTFSGAPALHLHGALFFSWAALFCVQAWLAATGRRARHRTLGLFGAVLVGAMCMSIPLAAIASVKKNAGLGLELLALEFMIVPALGLFMFLGLVLAALANVARPDWHFRLMLCANMPLVEAASGRIAGYLLAPPGAVGPPPVAAGPEVAMAASVAMIGIMRDFTVERRIHPAYVLGLTVYAANVALYLALHKSDGWIATARWIMSWAG